jgi:pilus assembly protein CpaE
MHEVLGRPSDVLVLDLSEMWEEELATLASRAPSERPAAIIAVGRRHLHEAQGVLLAAMKSGVRDFFFHPVDTSHLIKAVQQVILDASSASPIAVGKAAVTSIMNAKGGSGASLLACNIAYILSAALDIRVALIDFDLQFCSLSTYFDSPPSDALFIALDNVEVLDRVALDGYMTKYSRNLHLLPAVSDGVALPWRIPQDRISRLLFELCKAYSHVVIDLPRTFDVISKTILEESDNVLIVVQQHVVGLRDATRVMKIIRVDLGIPRERIHVVVNRYSKDGAVSLKDIEKAMDVDAIHLVPNDYNSVSSASDHGEPLFKRVPDAEVTKAIANIAYKLVGQTPTPPEGLLARMFKKNVSKGP